MQLFKDTNIWSILPSHLELVSKELNHLEAILHVYAGGKKKKKIVIIFQKDDGNTFTLLIIFIVKSL